MGLVGGLVAEEVAVRPGVKEPLIALPGPLPQGEGHGAVGVAFLDLPNQGAEDLVGKIAVLAPLEDKGAEVQGVALLAAGQNVLRGQAVAVAVCVAPPDTAVETVVFADVADLDEAPGVDGGSVDGLPGRPGQLGQEIGGLLIPGRDEGFVFGQSQAVVLCQSLDEGAGVLIHG